MKYTLFLFTAMTLIFSCKKEPDPMAETPSFWGESSATIDGQPWTAQPTAFINLVYGNNWHVVMNYYQNGVLAQGLELIKVPFTPGTYPIVNSDASVNDALVGADFTYWTSDQTDGYYKVLESDASSFVTVQSYDESTKELRGTFDITFLAVHKPPYADAVDTLRVRNGVFHTKVQAK